MTAGLGVTELVAWGTLVYAFSAFVVPMRAELGWSPAVFTTIYTAGSLVAGLVAVPVGRVLAQRSPHAVMLGGALLSCLALVAWSRVASPVWFAVVFALVGVAMATTLYEPAFVLTARWFDGAARSRAVAVITMLAGLAGTVFVPLAGVLSTTVGWRTALLVLAGICLVVAVPIHLVLACHDRPGPVPTVTADGDASAVRRASFWWVLTCLVASTAQKYAVIVLLVAFLVAAGHPIGTAALLAGLVGVLQVIGRFATAALAGRIPEDHLSVALFGVQAVALIGLVAGHGTVLAAVGVAGFGLGAGQSELLRGTLLVSLYGEAAYPRLNGIVSAFVLVARGAGPFLAGLLVTAVGSFVPAFLLAAALAVVAALALPIGLRRHRAEIVRS